MKKLIALTITLILAMPAFSETLRLRCETTVKTTFFASGNVETIRETMQLRIENTNGIVTFDAATPLVEIFLVNKKLPNDLEFWNSSKPEFWDITREVPGKISPIRMHFRLDRVSGDFLYIQFSDRLTRDVVGVCTKTRNTEKAF